MDFRKLYVYCQNSLDNKRQLGIIVYIIDKSNLKRKKIQIKKNEGLFLI